MCCFVDAGRAEFGLGRHDDHVAGQHGKDRMALDRLRHVGHRGGGVQAAAGKEIGQVVGVADLASAAEVALPLGNREFEDQHRMDVFRLGLLDGLEDRLTEPLGRPPGDRQDDLEEPSGPLQRDRIVPGLRGGPLLRRGLLAWGRPGGRLGQAGHGRQSEEHRPKENPGGHSRQASAKRPSHGCTPTREVDPGTNYPSIRHELPSLGSKSRTRLIFREEL